VILFGFLAKGADKRSVPQELLEAVAGRGPAPFYINVVVDSSNPRRQRKLFCPVFLMVKRLCII